MTLIADFLAGPICHRCLHDAADGRPENSWEALDAALHMGLAVEIDLQLSADGEPMVFHDYDLKRLTGRKGLLNEHSSSELTRFNLLHAQRPMPKFKDFMNYVDGRIPVLIEMKDQDMHLGSKETKMEITVCEILKSYEGRFGIMSFNPHMVARISKLLPNALRGLVTDPFEEKDWPNVEENRRYELARIDEYDKVGASFISHNVNDLNSEAVAKIVQRGGDVFCWTVRCQTQEEEARKIAGSITFEGYLPQDVS